jgi:hypothetical protein
MCWREFVAGESHGLPHNIRELTSMLGSSPRSKRGFWQSEPSLVRAGTSQNASLNLQALRVPGTPTENVGASRTGRYYSVETRNRKATPKIGVAF